MAMVWRLMGLMTGAVIAALAAGFVGFAASVNWPWPASALTADGIVVLTGGDDRITAGLDLIAGHRGRRLLISGVNRTHRSPEELSRRIGEALPGCCIDLGYRAMNTIGNADEAREWTARWGFRSIMVVTSDFHMARSLTEFSRAMPGVKLIAHPVPSRYVRHPWWSSRVLAQSLAGEYVKFLASTVRFGASWMIGAWDNFRYAERDPVRPAASRPSRSSG